MNETLQNRMRSDRLVALGLGFVYAGLCLAVFSVIWVALVPEVIRRRPDLAAKLHEYYLLAFVSMNLVSLVLGGIGRVICLLVSRREIGIAFYVVIVLAAVLDVAGLVIGGFKFWNLLDPAVEFLEGMQKWILPLGLAGHVLFLVFLMRLSVLVKRPALTAMAGVAFASWAAVVGVLVYLSNQTMIDAILAVFRFGLPGLWTFGITGLVALITYGNTLSYLRTAFKERSAANAATEPSAEERTADVLAAEPSAKERPAVTPAADPSED